MNIILCLVFFVNYKQETIDAYQTMLKDIYTCALKPFHEMDPLDILRDRIVLIVNSKEIKRVGMTYHCFTTKSLFMVQITN
mmetsp:Transcript_31153/g.35760  ORF Transcript_31153/g.35760 Transcript_31153/m.35760 type:complete len:81 (-) Transcript_31153:84-326(-)